MAPCIASELSGAEAHLVFSSYSLLCLALQAISLQVKKCPDTVEKCHYFLLISCHKSKRPLAIQLKPPTVDDQNHNLVGIPGCARNG
ncbi:hypothetical protein Cflav_PD1498 [Pedosphaera parvula Ellin514]|uniref:Uncharacterized protein n=1 Tax=Pedosphaera parvula (strain Ellin514) TaxID=320771 RepID=B9XND8_PEDPL|nr:hypothetical protein Cflav_PD1498 [Pedosphaera parvula Ellin514]